MQKFIGMSLSCLVLSSAWAAQSPVHGLLPMKNQIINSAAIFTNNPVPLISDLVKAGGYGGNERIGRLMYLGTAANLPALTVSRDENGTCYLQNENVLLKDVENHTIHFSCYSQDPSHDYLYWNADLGAVNGGYSPENDVLYAADVITQLFKDWYDLPPVKNSNGAHTPLVFRLHYKGDNAYLSLEKEIIVGDGLNKHFPLTSLPVISYMVGLLFIDQHAHLAWKEQAGGMIVAFACMTAMAAEFYATGKNTWQIGPDVTKNINAHAIHYMDMPSKNCDGKKPGEGCDIDTLAQYRQGMSEYYSSGVFNRAFYLLATSSGWDTHKAYNVFVQTSLFHWKNSDTTFHDGACDVAQSAKELGYDTTSVMHAFSGVGIDTRDCHIF